jgi:transposase
VGIDLADLPSDVAALQALVRRFAEAVNAQELKIAQLEARIARLKRMQFGRSSEKIARDIEQLELELDELHEDHAERAVKPTPLQNLLDKPCRKPLPPPLPREEEVHEPACTCPSCGGAMRKLGEDVT